MSGAPCRRFRHGDLDHLEELLSKSGHYRRRFIVSESLFSMDGDRSDLPGLVRLKEEYDAFLIIDEAHAVGVFGPEGRGLVAETGLTEKVDALVGTMGKAFGSYGAYVCGTTKLKDFLINHARSFIFSTALPAAVVEASLQSLADLRKMDDARSNLQQRADSLRKRLRQSGFDCLNSSSQIIPLLCGSDAKALEISEKLKEAGILCLAIRPPTVPENQSRLRISLNTEHKDVHIDALCKALEACHGRG